MANTIGIIKAVFSEIWKYLLCFVLGALVMANCSGCNHDVVKPVKSKSDRANIFRIDSIKKVVGLKNDTIALLKMHIVKLDSISKIIKPAYRKAKKDNRNFIENNPCDSVGILNAYDLTVAKCDTVVLVDSLEIIDLKKENASCESINKDMVSMLQTKENQLAQRDIDLGIEQKKVKVQKRKKIVAIGLGILSVVATIGILK